MMAGEVLIDRDGHVLIITINRPAKRNAVTQSVSCAIAESLDLLDSEEELRVGILTGAGGNFCSGMDLLAFVEGERPELEGRGFGGLTEAATQKPLIAAVEGYALAGGCELALACDLIVAAEDAIFGLPEVARGLVAGSGGLIRMARGIPIAIAKEYTLTGRRMPAKVAHTWGMVNQLATPGRALELARALADEITDNAPLSVRMSKRIIEESGNWAPDEVWDRQRPLVDSVLASEDAQEGTRAFAEKREPIWRGR